MDPVVHFEMPYEDHKRVAKFYEKAFNWKTKTLGNDMGKYVLATAAEPNKDGFPKEPGRINGGFWQKDNTKPLQFPNIVIAVQNLQESMKKIEREKGKILGQPMDIPGYGTYVCFLDTEGNRAAIIQPTRMEPKDVHN